MYMPMILVNLIVFEREKGSESSKFYEIFLNLYIYIFSCFTVLYCPFYVCAYESDCFGGRERERKGSRVANFYVIHFG